MSLTSQVGAESNWDVLFGAAFISLSASSAARDLTSFSYIQHIKIFRSHQLQAPKAPQKILRARMLQHA